jgi:hypothetical protein
MKKKGRVVADALSRLDIDSLKIQEDEQAKVKGLREKGLAQTHY